MLKWPLDPMTLMWIQVATGAVGMLNVVYLFRWLARKFGSVPEINAHFSPKGGCQEAIVRELKEARSEILVQAYSFTADPLTFGLVEAKKRGVTVDIVLDKSNEVDRYSDLHFFIENEMDVKIDHAHAIAHNKIIIIDGKILITGSYNFTNQAENENAENLMVIKGHPEMVGHYRENFFKHRDHAKPAEIKEMKDRRPAYKAAQGEMEMVETLTNYRADPRGAKAFWNQHELPPYQELLRDTADWLAPTIGQRWLDLGCGTGQLSRIIWEKSAGKIETVVGVDVADIHEKAYASLRARLNPRPTPMCLRFIARDFTHGFADWPSAQFDGVVSGLSLPYAESFREDEGRWDETAYDRVLAEVSRLLKPGGTFVFSVNVPEPAWSKVAWQGLAGTFGKTRPIHSLKNAYRMWTYGSWLTREARRGRFHYLPLENIVQKLESQSFIDIEHRLSYANQAYLIRCGK